MSLEAQYELPAAADFHVHLRDGLMSEAVVPTIRQGGVNVVYVMPNLQPPITTVQQALEYKSRLEAIDSTVTYLMTLYLHKSITPEVVRVAKKAGIVGIKSYPHGVTTNSADGVLSYDEFCGPGGVFATMEEEGLVLNLHGECPSDGQDVTILNAESKFLPTLKFLHKSFPRLKIVLEHCTTAAAVAAVQDCGDTVVGTITAHHLCITVEDWAGDVFCYCKPVAKLPSDRRALLNAAVTSKGKFFLGTDSAPHPISAKKGPGKGAAGVFTQPQAVQHVLTAFDEGIERGDISGDAVTQELLEGYLGGFGRAFYGVDDASGERILVRREPSAAISTVSLKQVEGEESVEVVPFRNGEMTWSLRWLPAAEGGEAETGGGVEGPAGGWIHK